MVDLVYAGLRLLRGTKRDETRLGSLQKDMETRVWCTRLIMSDKCVNIVWKGGSSDGRRRAILRT